MKNSSKKDQNTFSLDLTLNDFLQLAEKNFFDSDEISNKFYKFHIFFFTNVYENYSKDTYGMIFSLFSLLKDEKSKYSYFFQLLKIINSSDINFDLFIRNLEQFLQINLPGYSGYVTNFNFGAEHEDSKGYVKNLIDSVYNPQNINHFVEKVVEKFNKRVLKGKSRTQHIMTEDDIKLIFDDNKYFFDFLNLRSYFLSIYGQV
jgi:hypothetical protein